MADSLRAPGADPVNCRRCGKPLARRSIGFGCAACGGLFIGGDEWDGIVAKIRAGDRVDVATIVPPPPGSPQPDRLKPVSCASCGGPMDRLPFGARSGIVVDVCAKHGIWLDGGELVGVLEFVRRLWANNGRILTPEEQRDAIAERDLLLVKIEDDRREAERLAMERSEDDGD
jgi:Zn-finger nucleic acid-binding protein